MEGKQIALITCMALLYAATGFAQQSRELLAGFYLPQGIIAVPNFLVIVGENPQDIDAAKIVMGGLSSFVEQEVFIVTEVGRIESSRVTEFGSNNYILVGTPKSNRYIAQEITMEPSIILTTATVKKLVNAGGWTHIMVSGENPDDVIVAARIFKELVSEKPMGKIKPKVGIFEVLKVWIQMLVA